MLGAGNYTVEVHADVDMSESQATRESFPENDRALTSERITRSTSGTSAPAVGIPGALSNQPPQATTVTAEGPQPAPAGAPPARSEEHTSELQSLMRISYAVFCLKKKNIYKHITIMLQTYTE